MVPPTNISPNQYSPLQDRFINWYHWYQWKRRQSIPLLVLSCTLSINYEKQTSHGVGDPGLVGLVSVVFYPTRPRSPTPCKQGLNVFSFLFVLLFYYLLVINSYLFKRTENHAGRRETNEVILGLQVLRTVLNSLFHRQRPKM